MKLPIIIAIVCVASVIGTGVVAYLGMYCAASGKKVLAFLCTVSFVAVSVLIVGIGVRLLPMRTVMSQVLIGAAWCIGSPLGLRLAYRSRIAAITKRISDTTQP